MPDTSLFIGKDLLQRFRETLVFADYFDVIVGYFRASGFYLLKDALKDVNKIRILVGMTIDSTSIEIVEYGTHQEPLPFLSHQQAVSAYGDAVEKELNSSEDSDEVEDGIKTFYELVKSGQLEIRGHPEQNIHAKVYIIRNKPGPDFGRIITGSSNFSRSGFVDHLEFNVEIKQKYDVDKALDLFEKLWAESVPLSEAFLDTAGNRTWLRDDITPYDLYLKFLYEYFKEDINLDKEFEAYLPEGFMDLAYQKQAVVSARRILDTYNGVFISDVVGLGKTYIAALLSQQLPGRKLIICPPVLVDYWKETFIEFGIGGFEVISLGKLDQITKAKHGKFQYVFIDESHRFRHEMNQSYEDLYNICWGKKVVLITATPFNNSISDLASQIYLFQTPKKSLIPGIPNIKAYFDGHIQAAKRYPKGSPEYSRTVKESAADVRERVLKHIMVRRTRHDIERFFKKDIKEQGLSFPIVADPQRCVYQFDLATDHAFNLTLELLEKFTYARYTPLLYLTTELSSLVEQSQKNISGFMKGTLVKRLESSFYAFQQTINRFIYSYEKFLEMLQNGTVYISKKVDVYEFLDVDDEDSLLRLVEEGKVEKFSRDIFESSLESDLKSDLTILYEIQNLWKQINTDPKLDEFKRQLKTNTLVKNQKLIVFTESAETATYLYQSLLDDYPEQVMKYSSKGGVFGNRTLSKTEARNLIRSNFDPKEQKGDEDIRILITTDVLSEGVNLHQAYIVINYDLPWNPTRVLQRVGRVNRVGTKHKKIFIFNFFPSSQGEGELGLEANIKLKLHAFQQLLGEDAKFITDEEEIGSYELFGEYLYQKLNDRQTYENQDSDERSELEYLSILRDLRDNHPEVFSRIKSLPKKARTCRKGIGSSKSSLLTFFRKGRIKKFFVTDAGETRELTFFDAAEQLKSTPETSRMPIPLGFHKYLSINKSAFDQAVAPESQSVGNAGGVSNEKYILLRLKSKDFRYHPAFTDDDDAFIQAVVSALELGKIPKKTCKTIKNKIDKIASPMEVFKVLRLELPDERLLQDQPGTHATVETREVVLSEFYLGE